MPLSGAGGRFSGGSRRPWQITKCIALNFLPKGNIQRCSTLFPAGNLQSPKRRSQNESDSRLKWFPSLHTSEYGACLRIVACGLLPFLLVSVTSALLP
jgi:hypothetical protein